MLLPTPVGTIGQLLPPGAGANLLRSTTFFEGNGGGHLAVLAGWALLGLIALALGARRHRPVQAGRPPPRRVHAPPEVLL